MNITETTQQIIDHFDQSLRQGQDYQDPYRHWIIKNIFPEDVLKAIYDLPFKCETLTGDSGARDYHNDQRKYFDQENRKKFPVCETVCRAFNSPEARKVIEEVCACDLSEDHLRIEYAQDTKGFWLQPHTDIGVKAYTMILYLGAVGMDDERKQALGTDIYSDADHHYKSVPFVDNSALIFVPSHNTWHGFEECAINGIRKSLIINFVTNEWREKGQLAFR